MPTRSTPSRIRNEGVPEAFIAAVTARRPAHRRRRVRWVADVFARLFLTYISMPPTDPNFTDDAELRRFAHQVLTPMVERAVG